jgi:hypothetical protein
VGAIVQLLLMILLYFVLWREPLVAVRAELERQDVPPRSPPPRRDGWTAFAMGSGFFALAVGFFLPVLTDGITWLKWGASEKAWLLFLYGIPALLAFGPGVYLARRRWRRRFGPDHRGEWRAAFLAALGIWLTVGAAALTINRDPALRSHLFGGDDPAGTRSPSRAEEVAGRLMVVKLDPDAEVVAERLGERVLRMLSGGASAQSAPLQPDARYDLSIRKGPEEIHREVIRLKRGESRKVEIPRIVLPERTVRLVPKAGSFPTDVTRMQLTPDHSAVAVELARGPIVVFDAATGKERFTVARPPNDCTAFGFTPDGKQLAYLTRNLREESVLRVADAMEGTDLGKELRPKDSYFSNALALAFSPDGKRLAVSSAYNQWGRNVFQSRLHRWEWPGGKQLPATAEAQDGAIVAVRFTPDGSEVAAVSEREEYIFWTFDAAVNAIARRGTNERLVQDLVTNTPARPPGIVITGYNESAGGPDIFVGVNAGLVKPEALGPTRLASVALSHDGALLAAGTRGGAVAVPWERRAVIRLWDAKTGKDRAVLLGQPDWALDLAFAADGRGLISAGKDGTLCRWDLSVLTPPPGGAGR